MLYLFAACVKNIYNFHSVTIYVIVSRKTSHVHNSIELKTKARNVLSNFTYKSTQWFVFAGWPSCITASGLR